MCLSMWSCNNIFLSTDAPALSRLQRGGKRIRKRRRIIPSDSEFGGGLVEHGSAAGPSSGVERETLDLIREASKHAPGTLYSALTAVCSGPCSCRVLLFWGWGVL